MKRTPFILHMRKAKAQRGPRRHQTHKWVSQCATRNGLHLATQLVCLSILKLMKIIYTTQVTVSEVIL